LIKKKEEETSSDAPEVIPEAQWLWVGFSTLSGQRLYKDDGPQPITISDVYSYSKIEGHSTAESSWLLEVVCELDRLFIEKTQERLDKEQRKASKRSGRSVKNRN
jgi:hypothetical protein